jgi:hypothetical protein
MRMRYLGSAMTSAIFSIASTVSAAFAAPENTQQCLTIVADLAAKADDTDMATTARRYVEDMLSDMEGQCGAQHFGVARRTAERIAALIGAAGPT